MLKEQKNLLKLIKEIDALCRANDITYYAAGGTVIGAVRHKGFIPWDDDIDIYMTRANWNKFRECMETQIPEGRILECWENNRGYQNLLGRYMDKNTTAIFKYQLYGDANMGQLIDVFVLDPVIDDPEALKAYERDVMLASDLVGDCISYSDRLTYCDEYEKLRNEMETRGRDVVVNEVVDRLEQYTEEESGCYMLRWGGIPHIFPKEMFQEPVYLQFEDMQMAMPTKISDYLCQLYGMDWMYIPPAEGQIVHSYIIADNNMPYDRMKKLVYPRVDTSAADRFVEKKKKVFANLEMLHDADSAELNLQGDYVVSRIMSSIKRQNIDVMETYQKGEFEALWKLFADYINMQSHKYFIGNGTFEGYYRKWNPVYVDIGDRNLYVILQIMLEKNMISRANKILTVREMKAGPLDEGLAEIKELMEVIRRAADMYENGRYAETEQLVDEYYGKTGNLQLLKFKLFLIEERMGENPDEKVLAELKQWVKTGTERAPEDGDFNKFAGDILWFEGKHTASIEEYTASIVNTRNGVIRRLISERLADNIDAIDAYVSKTEDQNLFRAQIDAWVEVYPDNMQLLVKKLKNLDDEFDVLWNDDNLRELMCDEKPELLIKAVAERMNWTTQNVLAEIAVRQSDISSLEPATFDINKVRDVVDVTSERAIDLWQQAELLRLEGERKKAYQMYVKLGECSDDYVVKMVTERMKEDFANFISIAEKDNGKWIEADVEIKLSSFTVVEYIKFMKNLGIIGEEYSFEFDNASVTQMFLMDYKRLSEYLQSGNTVLLEEMDKDEE
ncbi:MAG: LicD family protein [Bacillota bacterium]|nr:LicD family protein [Bacillota bacterium]